MESTLQNPNAPVGSSNKSFWDSAIGNITKLFDSGAAVYATVTGKTLAQPNVSPTTAATVPPQQAGFLGLTQEKFTAYAAIGVGVLVLILIVKRR